MKAIAPAGLDPEPPLGAHILTPRWCYSHHGIYVGRGRVVHYGGLSRGLRRGPIEEVSLAQFAQGQPVFVRTEPASVDREEVVRRARSRLGENRYHVLTNNCEHFCEWCMCGEHRSYQVEDLVARYGAGRLVGLVVRRLAASASDSGRRFSMQERRVPLSRMAG